MDKIWDSVYKACVAWEERIGEGRASEIELDAITDAYTNAIAQAHEQEMLDAQEKWSTETALLAGQMRIATGLVKQANQQLEQLEAKNFSLRAQVAVMSEALRKVEWVEMLTHRHGRETIEPICPGCDAERDTDDHEPDCPIAQALASAPEVWFTEPVVLVVGGESIELQGPKGTLRLPRNNIQLEEQGQVFQLFILRSPEQQGNAQ